MIKVSPFLEKKNCYTRLLIAFTVEKSAQKDNYFVQNKYIWKQESRWSSLRADFQE